MKSKLNDVNQFVHDLIYEDDVYNKEEKAKQAKERYDEYMKAPLHWRDDKLQDKINIALLRKNIANDMYHEDFFKEMFNDTTLIACEEDSNRNKSAVVKKGGAYILYSDFYGLGSVSDAISTTEFGIALMFCKSVANDALFFKSIDDVILFLEVASDYTGSFYRFSDVAKKLLSELKTLKM